ncbi:MAG: hypothetical protein PHE83_17415 [Opitutaceae bacterium]|nr:hypothetical protein [Opitutaceae bacterium]
MKSVTPSAILSPVLRARLEHLDRPGQNLVRQGLDGLRHQRRFPLAFPAVLSSREAKLGLRAIRHWHGGWHDRMERVIAQALIRRLANRFIATGRMPESAES